MLRRGICLLLGAVVMTLLLGLWTWGRWVDMIPGPPSLMGEVIGAVLPALFGLFGVLSLMAARHHELPAKLAPELGTRLEPKEGDPATSLPAIFIWSSALAFGLSFLFVISLYPSSWSDSWECHQVDDGTACDLIDGTWYQYLIFVLCCLVVPLYGIGGPIAGILAFRALVRLIAIGRPILEISSAKLWPGGAFDVLAKIHGSRRCESFSLRLLCTEHADWPSGSSRSSATHAVYTYPIDERQHFHIRRGQPLEIRRSCALPADGMHTFTGKHNQILWTFALELDAPPVRIERSYSVYVMATPTAEGVPWTA